MSRILPFPREQKAEGEPGTLPRPFLDMDRMDARRITITILGVLTIFRLFYISYLPISEDEAYYWQWSRHLAFGYYDQGPIIAWLIRAGVWLLGPNCMGIRILALAMGLGISILLYDFCRRFLKDETLGLFLVVAANSTLLFAAASIIQTYDTSQAFFWLAAIHFTAMAIFHNRPAMWYPAGVFVGFCLLSKYTAGLLPILFLCFMAISKKHRFWLKRKEPWLSSLIAFIIFAPNLWWNAGHNWASIAFTLNKTSGDWNFTTFEYLGGQMGLLGPILAVFVIWGAVLSWKKARKKDTLHSFLLITSLPMLIIFFFISFKTRIQANWPGAAYPGLMLASLAAVSVKIRQSKKARRWMIGGLALGYLILAVAHFPTPVIKALNVPPDLNPFSKLQGWSGIGPGLDKALSEWPGKEKPFVFGLRYQLSSLAAYYMKGQPNVEGLFLPDSKLNSYLFWTDPALLKGREGLAVVYGRPKLEMLFDQVIPIRTLHLKGPSGALMHDVMLYRCVGFKGRDYRPAQYLGLK